MVSNHAWTGQLGIGWHLGVDGISLFLILMTTVLFPLALAGAKVKRDPRSFIVWMLVLESACLGSFVSLDLVLFFVFFELTLVPTYFVISGWGFEQRNAAAVKFFLYTFFGSAFMLVGIITLAVLHDQQTGKLTFDLVSLFPDASGTDRPDPVIPVVHGRVRGQGSAVPVPYVVSGRATRRPRLLAPSYLRRSWRSSGHTASSGST